MLLHHWSAIDYNQHDFLSSPTLTSLLPPVSHLARVSLWRISRRHIFQTAAIRSGLAAREAIRQNAAWEAAALLRRRQDEQAQAAQVCKIRVGLSAFESSALVLVTSSFVEPNHSQS
jgi:hypothetical protein